MLATAVGAVYLYSVPARFQNAPPAVDGETARVIRLGGTLSVESRYFQALTVVASAHRDIVIRVDEWVPTDNDTPDIHSETLTLDARPGHRASVTILPWGGTGSRMEEFSFIWGFDHPRDSTLLLAFLQLGDNALSRVSSSVFLSVAHRSSSDLQSDMERMDDFVRVEISPENYIRGGEQHSGIRGMDGRCGTSV